MVRLPPMDTDKKTIKGIVVLINLAYSKSILSLIGILPSFAASIRDLRLRLFIGGNLLNHTERAGLKTKKLLTNQS